MKIKVFLFKSLVSFILAISFIHSPSLAQTDMESFFGRPEKYENVVVQKILAIDLIELDSQEKIKLIGLKTPSSFQPEHKRKQRDKYGFVVEEPVTAQIPLQEQALSFVTDLLKGQAIRLEFDRQKVDENHLTLAYIFLSKSNIFVNKEILRQGYAHLHIAPPNTKYIEELRAAYREAREQKRGLQGQ